MKLSDDVLAVLDRSSTVGSILYLPPGQLDRKLYEAVNKVIVAAGGKWNRGRKGHVFDGIASDAIEPVILTGEVTNKNQEFGQFFTPAPVAKHAADLCRIEQDTDLLEPSAGKGMLALVAVERGAVVDCIELDEKLATELAKLRGKINMAWQGDFLAEEPSRTYQRVLMNPPFAKRADIHHVNHAVKFIESGGRLVAIMSAGITFRQDKLTVDFRAMVSDRGGIIIPLPEDSFKSSGTSVNTAIVAFDVR